MSENALPKSLRLAPSPERVFKRPDYHAKYFLPLLTLELSEIFDDLSGSLHFIDPIEPYDGCIGGFTTAFHTYYCRENWISFKVKDGLYDCEAPELYFEKVYLKTHPVPGAIHESVREGWVDAVKEHYQKRMAKYAKWKADHIEVIPEHLKDHGIRPDNFGGLPCDANWAHLSDFPLDTVKEVVPDHPLPDQFHYPLTEDGRRFRYIGFMEVFDWRCAIHLFYDPVEQRALQTFDWT